jgi:protein ImuB
MRRVISVYLPFWPIEARRKRMKPSSAPDRPFAIAGQEGQKQVIVAADPQLLHDGIKVGMSLTHARTILPQIATLPAEPREDAKALERLAAGCLRFSPLVSPSAPDSLWIDATGVAHLFGGEHAMLTTIAKLLRRSGLKSKVAIAGTPGAAWALSHYGSKQIRVSEHLDDLDELPVSALRLGSSVAYSLWRVGIKTIGDLKKIPRTTLPLRFGRDVVLRLDQALGRAPESIDAMLPPQARRHRLTFVEPISTPEDLLRVTERLTADVCAGLDARQEGVRKLDLVFERVDGTIQVIRIGTARATRAPKHLVKLLAGHFETVDPGFGIEAAALTAWRVTPLFPSQTHAGGAQESSDVAAMVDALANRMGTKSVYRMAHVATHIPERAVQAIVPMNTAARANPDGWPATLPRPIHLFSPPELIEVMALLPDHPPRRFKWRGRMRFVRTADGPERIFGEWWQKPGEVPEARDYFRLEDEEGERYWVFNRHQGRPELDQLWYLHGLFA